MAEKELRGCDVNKEDIKFIEENRVYPLEIFDNKKYTITKNCINNK